MRVYGPTRLCGTVAASGSKNAALPIMAAALLADGPVVLRNVPRLTDTATLARMLETLGMSVEWDDGKLRLQAIDHRPVRAARHLVRRMRASFCVLGPLLARRRRAIVPLPGGCRIGQRPIDLHLRGLAALGAEIDIQAEHVVAKARRLEGARIDLWGPRGPTVTGTANVLSAAVLARGVTVIEGAACEPEIVDLGRFLQSLGAKIGGLGTHTIVVDGVEEIGGNGCLACASETLTLREDGVEELGRSGCMARASETLTLRDEMEEPSGGYRIIPDRIETATLLLAAAITRGSIVVNHTEPNHLSTVIDAMRSAGARVEIAANVIRLTMSDRPAATNIAATPYPGFPTDLQAQWTAWMCLAKGQTTVRDDVFPARFAHAAALRRFGARIVHHGSAVRVEGVRNLYGASVNACDLRASAALVLAGLAAEGETRLGRPHHLYRGYECLDDKLATLGAEMVRGRPMHNALALRS